jgi:wyosine [tRNA(Phe)-imidazoG37] synthetase (radical SAM superfamily)
MFLINIYRYFSTTIPNSQDSEGIYQNNIRLNLVGGEPATVKNFKAIIEIAHRIGFTVGLVINGSLIDEDFIIQYSKYLCVIGFSIDTTEKELMLKIGRTIPSGKILDINQLYRKINLLRSCKLNHHNDDITRGLDADRLDQNQKAIEDCDEAIWLGRKDIWVYNNRGYYYLELRRYPPFPNNNSSTFFPLS